MKRFTGTVLIPFVLGVPLFIFGLKELYQVNEFVQKCAQADGIIVDMENSAGILSKFHPSFRFQTQEGIAIEFSPGNTSNPPHV